MNTGSKRARDPPAGSMQSTQDSADASESRRKKLDAIRSDVTESVRANPEQLLEELYDRWELDARHTSVEDFTRLALANMGIPSDADIFLNRPSEYGLHQLDEAIMRHEMEAIALYQALRQRDPTGENPELQLKATKIIEMVYYAKRVVLSAFQARLAVHQLHCSDVQLDPDLDKMLGSWTLRFRWFDPAKSTALQKLLLHLLDTAMERRYRKHNGYVYEPVVVDGYETHAWRQVCEIKEFVYEATRKELHWEQWENLTASGNNARMAVEHLSCANDFQFPFLHKDRSVFAFRNGVYLAREDRFYSFGGGGEPLSDSVVAARFFDAEMQPWDEVDDWRDIPTPFLQSIMTYQEWPRDVCDWLYISLGRLLYAVGERDGWQIIPFMLGAGSSGKCFCESTRVMLFDGSTRAVEDIRVGDLVMGDDATPRRVLSLARGVDDMYTLVPKRKGYESLTVTGEHILCLKFTNQGSQATWRNPANQRVYGTVVQYWDVDEKKARAKKLKPDALEAFKDAVDREEVIEMTVHEYMALPEYLRRYLVCYRVPLDFAVAEEPLFDPWTIGAWLGDGYSTGNGFTTADEEIEVSLRAALEDAGGRLTKRAAQYQFGICGTERGANPLVQALRAYGLINNKHIPHALKTGSRHTRMELLAGLLDTDGFFDKRGYYEITQKNKRLADDIVFVARSLGFGVSKTAVAKACTWKGERREGTYHRVNIFGEGLADIPVRVGRKKAVAERKSPKDARRWGFDVVPAGRQEYYGFQCDGNQRFVLGDFSVTHNSTIVLKVAKMFYEHADVGVLSNNVERQFGISAFWDKLLFCGPEIKGDLKIEQAEFQSIVSGESVQVAAKHKKAFTVEWSTPGILAGNEVPAFTDNAGSVQRRFLVFAFNKTVLNGDMKLAEKLGAELPAILLKCNRAYLDASTKWGSRNVWTVLHPYFQDTRAEMAQAVNSVEAFLASMDVVVDAERWCPFDEFRDAWRSFSLANGYTQQNKGPITANLFRTPFEKYGIRVEKGTRREYRGTTKKGQWVVGVDLADRDDGGALG